KNGRPSAVTPPKAHSLPSNRRLSTVRRGCWQLWVATWAASAMDRLERKLSGAVFNASIPPPKSTEYSPRVHRFTLPAPEYRRSHVGIKFSLGEEGWLRHQEDAAKPPYEGADGVVSPGQRYNVNMYHNDHPVCAASEASRLFLTGAATPPVPGGEHPVLAINQTFIDRRYSLSDR